MMNHNQIRHPRTERRVPRVAIVIGIFILVLLIAGIWIVSHFLGYRPNVGLGQAEPPTTMPEQTADTSGDDPADPDTTEPAVVIDPTEVRRENFYTFLVMGRDNVGLNTDVIMLVSFDTANHKVAAVQIPRDTYIELDGESHKINSLYAVMTNRARAAGADNVVDTAMRGMIGVLEDAMNTVIDYYAIVNLTGFGNIVDILGGVEMYVPCDMVYDDPYQDLHINLREGQQTLNGAQAQQFIRYRAGYIQGDIGRVEAQKIFLSALVDRVKSSLNISTVTAIAKEVLSNMNTSLTVEDFIFFGREFLSVDTGMVTLITFPGTETRANGTSGAWYYVMHRADFLTILNAYFNVFRADIPDEMFDRNRVFTDESRSFIDDYYCCEPLGIEAYVHSSQQISDDGLKIDIYR